MTAGMAAAINGIVFTGPPVGPGGIFSLGDPAALEAVGPRAPDSSTSRLPSS